MASYASILLFSVIAVLLWATVIATSYIECSSYEDECPSGLICVGPKVTMRCAPTRPVGSECDSQQYLPCEPGVLCRDGLCTESIVSEGGNCLPFGSVCESGTVCAGRNGRKKCVLPMKEGEFCKGDPFWVCEEGLECSDNLCIRPVVPKGGDCSAEGAVCEEGTVCKDKVLSVAASEKRCIRPREEGERCKRDPFWMCAEGLSCAHNRCISGPFPKGGNCLQEGSVCADGLVCAGKETRKKCVVPMKEGEFCKGDVFWVCEAGLDCVGKVCVRPFVPEGENCDAEGANCEEGTTCIGRRGKKRCVRPMKEGERCKRDPFWRCAEGLECVERKCRREGIPERGNCLEEESNCADGLECVGRMDKKICKRPMKEGERCKTDPFWVCETGLSCIRSRCRADPVFVGRGEKCDGVTTVCKEGFHCVMSTRREVLVCGPIRFEGNRCKNSSRFQCASGLQCVHGRCRLPGKY